jgi:hypothetical protein
MNQKIVQEITKHAIVIIIGMILINVSLPTKVGFGISVLFAFIGAVIAKFSITAEMRELDKQKEIEDNPISQTI